MKTTAALLVAGSMLAAATPAMAQDSENFNGFRLEALAIAWGDLHQWLSSRSLAQQNRHDRAGFGRARGAGSCICAQHSGSQRAALSPDGAGRQ